MAVNPRYYRGQYSPYGNQQYSADIISMYNPEQEARFTQAMQERQGRFDTAVGAIATEKARIGDIETYDHEQLTNRLNDFEGKINDLVQSKYKGDYGAAAAEIVNLIGEERTNPFYQYNKQKTKAIDSYNKAKQTLGANFLSTKNPYEVDYSQWQKGADFDFTPINKNDIVATSQNIFKNLAKTMQEDPEILGLDSNNPFVRIISQQGFRSPEQLMAFLGEPEGEAMLQQVYDSMPELANLDQGAVHDAILQGAYSALGQRDVKYMQNPNFVKPGTSGGAGGGYNSIVPGGMTPIETKKRDLLTSPHWEEERNAAAVRIAKEYNLKGVESWDDLNKVLKNTNKANVLFGARASLGNMSIVGELATKVIDPLLERKLSGDKQTIGEHSVSGVKHEVKKRMTDPHGGSGKQVLNYKMGDLVSARPEDITKINKVNDQLDKVIGDNLESIRQFSPLNKESKKGLESLSKNIKVNEFGITRAGLFLGISGKDSDDNPKGARFDVDNPYMSAEIITYLAQIDGEFLNTYINDFIAPLYESNPTKAQQFETALLQYLNR